MVDFQERDKKSILKKFKVWLARLQILKISKIDQIGFFFFAAFILSTTLTWLFEERFNIEQWKSQPRTRYKMADDIIDNNIMLGKTKEEVISLLGIVETSNLEGREHLIYRLGKAPSFIESKEERLVVVFENNIVVKVIQTNE